MKLRAMVPFLFLAFAGAVVAGAAAPEPRSDAITVSLEISGKKDERPREVILAVDRGCASYKEKRDASSQNVTVCREGGTLDAPALAFTVEESTEDRVERRFQMSMRAPLGRTVAIGRSGGAEGTEIEIRATARR
jgi:hypothetical protein